ncbi:MAG: O-methyltransferase, partial [Bradymonadaceae bacterium]
AVTPREFIEERNIDLRLQPAAETLDELLEAGRSESFEFAFIDADKENYELYYERCLELLAPGGLVAIDNALWSGSVADPEIDDAATEAIRAVNRTVAGDERVTPSLVPIGDGVFLARKRPTG